MALLTSKRFFLSVFVLFMINSNSFSQTTRFEIPLYGTEQIPGNLPGPDEEEINTTGTIIRVSKVKNPTLTVYLPPVEKSNGTGIIICPGGGYGIVAIDHEGYQVAEVLNAMGIAAFVLKYRMPDPKNQSDPSIAPLQDAQQAMWYVRKNSKKFHLDTHKIGIMGFSAGGHLAASEGVHFDDKWIADGENISLRPDFMILGYPVISADTSISHKGSFKNLLGNNPTREKLDYFSLEKHVDSNTPPAFFVLAADDRGVPPDNSIRFFQALKRNNVPAELHIYQNGGHGFGLHNKTTKDDWMGRCRNWMIENNWLPE